MDKRTYMYWASTAVISLIFIGGGFANLFRIEPQQQAMAELGYPMYLMTLLGIAKLLAVVALLAPAFPLLKEWAYAGLVFDLIGAGYSHAANGDPLVKTLIPVVIILILGVSYRTRPNSRRI